VLEPAIDTGGPMGRMGLTVLGMVAEMERAFIRDRRRAGIDAAKAKGVYKGRPATFNRARIVGPAQGRKGATEIAKAAGCKRGNVIQDAKAAGLN
jgi:DNA invertase Pin-like site-specific DNA recombinase